MAAAILVVAVCAYGRSPALAHSGDDLQYAALIRAAVTGEEAFHPSGVRVLDPSTGRPLRDQVPLRWPAIARYPLDTLTATVWAKVRRGTETSRAVQGFRALCGAGALLGVFLVLRRWGISRSTSVVAVGSLAVSAAFWEYSTHIDYSITAVALVVAATWAGWPALARPAPGAPILVFFRGARGHSHRAAGGSVYALEVASGEKGGAYCWDRILQLAGPPAWSGLGVTARPLRFPEGPLAGGALCAGES